MKTSPPYSLSLFALAVLLNACISSEETGGASEPIPTPRRVMAVPKDTGKPQRVEVKRVAADSAKPIPIAAARISPKLKSKQDTVQTSLVRKRKPSPKPFAIKVERPDDAMYTVQVGAFQQASNALRNHKKAKDRFSGQPAYNRFHKASGFYRVSIGRFADFRDAATFRKEMMRQYPNDYSKCWVNYIAR